MNSQSTSTITSGPSRGLTIMLWVFQILCALMFLFAGGTKLVGPPESIQGFEIIGLGQWFRYLTGALEVLGGLALLLPTTAAFGAVVLMCVMVGAILTHLFVLPGSPVPAAVLLLLLAVIAWCRRGSLHSRFAR